MFYHASGKPNLTVLKPFISNHGVSQVYLSKKRENTAVYLSNAVEKFCKEKGFSECERYKKWATYGFNQEGILILTEYYPNAFLETYKGVKGFIYSASHIEKIEEQKDIPYSVTSKETVYIDSCEPIDDAYDEIIKLADERKIILETYASLTNEKIQWINKTIRLEYKNSDNNPEYQFFLKSKFNFL